MCGFVPAHPSRMAGKRHHLQLPEGMEGRTRIQWSAGIHRIAVRVAPNLGRLLLGACSMTLILTSCAQNDQPPPFVPARPAARGGTESPNTLRLGESVELFVMEDPSFNGIYRIREKGDIIIPKVGRIGVQGLTVEAAQSKIQQNLLSSQLTSATVILDRVTQAGVRNFAETPKLLVFVTGKVNKPGQHMIAVEGSGGVLAYEALLIAGGPTQFADEKHSYILRKGAQGSRQKIPVDFRSIRQGNANDVPLVEGDMIFVPERRFAL